MKPALALMDVEVAQDLEEQGVAEEDMAGEDVAEGDAINKRHSDIRTVVIISST
jgi:hypothetical protein